MFRMLCCGLEAWQAGCRWWEEAGEVQASARARAALTWRPHDLTLACSPHPQPNSQLQAEVVNGPTTDAHPHPLPPFSWHEPAVANLTHRGQPQRFKGFRFQRMDPAAPLADMPDACSAPGTAAPGGGEQGGAGAGGSASGEARGFWALLLGSGGRERAERATLTSSLLTS